MAAQADMHPGALARTERRRASIVASAEVTGLSQGPSDGELVRKTLAGDREAFGTLVERYERLLGVLAFQKVGNRGEAEDVAQEAFLKAFAALEELRDPERFGPWLYGIAFRAAMDQLRRRGRRGVVVPLGDVEAEAPGAGEDASGAASRREQSERLVAALGELPDKYRLVLTLRYQKMMSYQEIAAHLEEPSGTIANRIHRAVKMLRGKLRELWTETTS